MWPDSGSGREKEIPMSNHLLLGPVMMLLTLLAVASGAQAQEPPEIDLSGRWKDGAREVIIRQEGSEVIAEYVEPFPLCDPQDGSEPQPYERDFEATLSGDSLIGEVTVCNWGESWGGDIGIQEADMQLRVSPDGNTLSGMYESYPEPAEMTLTRVGCSPDDGGEVSAEDVVAAVVEGFRSRGLDVGSEHVAAVQSAESGLWIYRVRLDSENRPLPSGETIISAHEEGLIEEGRQTGATSIFLGSVQEAGERTRVTARKVDVETAEVGETGRGDADGTGPCAIAEAFGHALDGTGIVFGEAQQLVE
jgi:hypothetical protein